MNTQSTNKQVAHASQANLSKHSQGADAKESFAKESAEGQYLSQQSFGNHD